jgi:hypothetical protein
MPQTRTEAHTRHPAKATQAAGCISNAKTTTTLNTEETCPNQLKISMTQTMEQAGE